MTLRRLGPRAAHWPSRLKVPVVPSDVILMGKYFDKMTINCEAGCEHEVLNFFADWRCPNAAMHAFNDDLKHAAKVLADVDYAQPMIELDDALAAAAPWRLFDQEMEWAALALNRGDVFRWKSATFAALARLRRALHDVTTLRQGLPW